MTWSTTPDVATFLAAAGEFLRTRPVEHTVLLTEAAYLQARPSTAADQCYGWWSDDSDAVKGAFLQAPGHPPILSMMPTDALGSLPGVLTDATAVGVDGRMTDCVIAVFKCRRGNAPTIRSRITLHRLGRFVPPALPPGNARTAGPGDREMLLGWFHRMMAAYPDDPSEAAYVVDDPLSFGGITLWETGGRPRAMAGRSRIVAGMTRLSAVYTTGAPSAADAAFASACAAADQLAEHVLVFGEPRYRAWGFEPVLDRVMLTLPG